MLYTLALTFIPDLPLSQQLQILRSGHRVEDVIMRPNETLQDVAPPQRARLAALLAAGREEALRRAREELTFCQRHGIQVLSLNDDDYPERLRDCVDAPAVLYYKGNVPLNARYVISVVGTRRITDYGKQMCGRFMKELLALMPEALVISGLAYGVDIHAHRGAMEHGLATVGVVAHGLDRIYPAVHRNDAKQMVGHGGILTEYPRGISPLPGNFLRRNRIIAGMADCVVVVESAEHGGSLVTAKIANSYARTVFAVPGRITDNYSVGCNNLIERMQASIATSVESIAKEMGWWADIQNARQQDCQLSLFAEEEMIVGSRTLSPYPSNQFAPEQMPIVQALAGTDGLDLLSLAMRTHLAQAEVRTLLFDMEMSGLVHILPGGFYALSQ